MRGAKEPVAIPNARYVNKVGGPEIKIRLMDPSETMVSAESSSPTGTSSAAGVSGWQKTKKSPETIYMEKQITPAEKAFSVEKLEKLMAPFEVGEYSFTLKK